MQRSPELELKSVILLAFAHFTVDFYTGFVAPLVPVLKEQMGFSITKAAFLISVFSLTSSMGQTIFGFLFDRVRNLAPVVLGPLCAGLFLSALGVAGSYPVAIALLVAGGLESGRLPSPGSGSGWPQERPSPQRRSLNLRDRWHRGSGYGRPSRGLYR